MAASPTSPMSPQPHESMQEPISPQQQHLPRPDPVMQAVIEADFRPVDLTLDSANVSALCSSHSREKCDECDVDFVQLNRLSKVLTAHPKLPFPPPPHVVNQKLSQIVNQTKEEGNALYRTHQWEKAIGRYNQATGFAMQRAPWETQQLLREELSTVLSNRSAAYFEKGDLLSAITDADAVIQLRKPWSKGHFRKAKALIALGKMAQAKEVVQYGLQFDPVNEDMMGVLKDIEHVMRTYASQPRPPTSWWTLEETETAS
ncbi:hypothetical protein F5148DRAFT_1367964 [Russula earlei]|uniref:Uncharacterized protein n=1 Tax=Russula earlei TaxID=71964 RepID=A0ACC0UBD6_9AGAM|nr:hypothetical protein F5148DRAFT_1367964 [Russula earlei]